MYSRQARTSTSVWAFASGYFDLIGTNDKSYDEIQAELYKLACSVNLSIGGTRSYFRDKRSQRESAQGCRYL